MEVPYKRKNKAEGEDRGMTAERSAKRENRENREKKKRDEGERKC